MLNITGEMHHLLKVSSWLVQCTQVHIHRCTTHRLACVYIITHTLYVNVYSLCQCCFPSCYLVPNHVNYQILLFNIALFIWFHLDLFLFVSSSLELSTDVCWCCIWVMARAEVSLLVRSAVASQGSGHAGSEHVIEFDRNSARHNPHTREKTLKNTDFNQEKEPESNHITSVALHSFKQAHRSDYFSK